MRAFSSSAPLDVGRPDGNFVWLGLGRAAAPVVQGLKERGVLVRSFPAFPTRLRVSVGTRAECDRFLAAFAEVLA
jgi:histidinol-phosphate/aromatic aminotransferase/cobyric acid decarboxylase-like protein